MMRKLFQSICLIIMILTLSACENEEINFIDDSHNMDIVVPDLSVPATLDYDYSGTFNEEVFNHLRQDIVLQSERISLPCSLNDLGEDFTFLKKSGNEYSVIENENTNMAILMLCYGDEEIATVSYALSDETNHDYSNDPILGISMNHSSIQYSKLLNHLSIGGVVVDETTEDEIIEKFGEPTRINKLAYGWKQMYYEGCFGIWLNDDKKVNVIHLESEYKSFDEINMINQVDILNNGY